jgi:hypothetical protein
VLNPQTDAVFITGGDLNADDLEAYDFSMHYRVYETGTTPGAFNNYDFMWVGILISADEVNYNVLSAYNSTQLKYYSIDVYYSESTGGTTNNSDIVTATFTAVPEPSTWALFDGAAVLSLSALIRRRK